MFDNALERAVLSNIEIEGAIWEGHPYYQEVPTDEDPVDDDENREPTADLEVAWEDHP